MIATTLGLLALLTLATFLSIASASDTSLTVTLEDGFSFREQLSEGCSLRIMHSPLAFED